MNYLQIQFYSLLLYELLPVELSRVVIILMQSLLKKHGYEHKINPRHSNFWKKKVADSKEASTNKYIFLY